MDHKMEQGTPEWFAARLGKVTASRVADVIGKTKSGYGAGRKNYEAELIAQLLTGISPPSFSSSAMQWGTDTEPQARAAYEFITGNDVIEIGFSDHLEIDMSGASPDGLVGPDGMLEIKCPNTATHINTLLTKKVPKKYNTQMQWQMACCAREWCDFVSFDPRLPADLQLFMVRVPRDKDLITELETEVKGFIEEMNNKIGKLREDFNNDPVLIPDAEHKQ